MCLTTEDKRLPHPTPWETGDQVGPSKELTLKWTQEGIITSYQVMRYAGDWGWCWKDFLDKRSYSYKGSGSMKKFVLFGE